MVVKLPVQEVVVVDGPGVSMITNGGASEAVVVVYVVVKLPVQEVVVVEGPGTSMTTNGGASEAVVVV